MNIWSVQIHFKFQKIKMKKRMKRFVLAENTEKDKNWKSSDNLLARVASKVSLINATKNDVSDIKEDVKDMKEVKDTKEVKDEQANLLSPASKIT